MRISLYFRWYDCWIGLYFDWLNRTLYLQLLPMIGLKLDFRGPKERLDRQRWPGDRCVMCNRDTTMFQPHSICDTCLMVMMRDND